MSSSQVPVVAAAITASVALMVGLITVWQRWRNDKRDDWWRRAQWAIDKSLSADPAEREVGSRSIGILVTQESGVTRADIEVLRVAALRAFMDFRRGPSGS